MTQSKDPAAVGLGRKGGARTAEMVRNGELPPDFYSQIGRNRRGRNVKPSPTALGQRIQAYCQAKAVSQREFADLAGLSLTMIGLVLRGMDPSPRSRSMIVAVLEPWEATNA